MTDFIRYQTSARFNLARFGSLHYSIFACHGRLSRCLHYSLKLGKNRGEKMRQEPFATLRKSSCQLLRCDIKSVKVASVDRNWETQPSQEACSTWPEIQCQSKLHERDQEVNLLHQDRYEFYSYHPLQQVLVMNQRKLLAAGASA